MCSGDAMRLGAERKARRQRRGKRAPKPMSSAWPILLLKASLCRPGSRSSRRDLMPAGQLRIDNFPDISENATAIELLNQGLSRIDGRRICRGSPSNSCAYRPEAAIDTSRKAEQARAAAAIDVFIWEKVMTVPAHRANCLVNRFDVSRQGCMTWCITRPQQSVAVTECLRPRPA